MTSAIGPWACLIHLKPQNIQNKLGDMSKGELSGGGQTDSIILIDWIRISHPFYTTIFTFHLRLCDFISMDEDSRTFFIWFSVQTWYPLETVLPSYLKFCNKIYCLLKIALEITSKLWKSLRSNLWWVPSLKQSNFPRIGVVIYFYLPFSESINVGKEMWEFHLLNVVYLFANRSKYFNRTFRQ